MYSRIGPVKGQKHRRRSATHAHKEKVQQAGHKRRIVRQIHPIHVTECDRKCYDAGEYDDDVGQEAEGGTFQGGHEDLERKVSSEDAEGLVYEEYEQYALQYIDLLIHRCVIVRCLRIIIYIYNVVA